MDYDDLPDVLTTLQEMYQTNRAFFSTYRFMNPETRDATMNANMRNTSNTLALLRHYMLLMNSRPVPAVQPQPVAESVLLNIPIRFDVSGNFWDPIMVRPTEQQIQNATERDIPVSDSTCAICQEAVTVATRLRHCGHCFHANCINEWFTQNARCPMCRHDIRQTQVPARPPAAAEPPDWELYIRDGSSSSE